jgi:hypothetical protein
VIIQSIGEIAGKPKTPLNKLFSKDASGWVDVIKQGHYPALGNMIDKARALAGQRDISFSCFSFQFPQSLDDFGLLKTLKSIYGDKYAEYASQWSYSDTEVIHQQIKIQESFQNGCPANSNNSLYFMVSDVASMERVVYVGIAKNGLLMRFFNGPIVHAQDNNYIGDCRSYESKSHPQYTWRVKSAELRRRGVCRIYWTILGDDDLKNSEKALIEYKLELIRKACPASIGRDPVNR